MEGRRYVQCRLVVRSRFSSHLNPSILPFSPSKKLTQNNLGFGFDSVNNAGNHAQGVALSGSRLGIPCTIVMPKGTPSIKTRNVSRLGAKVVLHGSDFDEAKAECARLASAHGLIFVPPYDDPLVIAGQGTVGMEILKQTPDSQSLDAIFAAVGGGGLVAGICEYVKRIGSPETRVFGGETFDGDAMERSLREGRRVTLDDVGPFSDGTAVRIVGEEPFRVCKEHLDGVVKVDNDEICAAIKDIFEGTHTTSILWPCLTIYNVCSLSTCRDTLHHRTRRRTRTRMSKTLHSRKQARRRREEVCRRRQRREYEL